MVGVTLLDGLPLDEDDGVPLLDAQLDTDREIDGECDPLTVTVAVRDATTEIDGVAERDVVTLTEPDTLPHEEAEADGLVVRLLVVERDSDDVPDAQRDGDVVGDIVVVSDVDGERDCVGETELEPLPLEEAEAAALVDGLPVFERD